MRGFSLFLSRTILDVSEEMNMWERERERERESLKVWINTVLYGLTRDGDKARFYDGTSINICFDCISHDHLFKNRVKALATWCIVASHEHTLNKRAVYEDFFFLPPRLPPRLSTEGHDWLILLIFSSGICAILLVMSWWLWYDGHHSVLFDQGYCCHVVCYWHSRRLRCLVKTIWAFHLNQWPLLKRDIVYVGYTEANFFLMPRL